MNQSDLKVEGLDLGSILEASTLLADRKLMAARTEIELAADGRENVADEGRQIINGVVFPVFQKAALQLLPQKIQATAEVGMNHPALGDVVAYARLKIYLANTSAVYLVNLTSYSTNWMLSATATNFSQGAMQEVAPQLSGSEMTLKKLRESGEIEEWVAVGLMKFVKELFPS